MSNVDVVTKLNHECQEASGKARETAGAIGETAKTIEPTGSRSRHHLHKLESRCRVGLFVSAQL